jgi:hypothetical protein
VSQRPATWLAVVTALASTPASAYRPFNQTDAAVAEQGEFEIELGPVDYIEQLHCERCVPDTTVL